MIGWGWLQDDPEVEADLAAKLISKWKLQGYIANAEAPYEDSGFWKSEAFCQRFRDLCPHTPLAVSPMGQGAGPRPFDYWAWMRAGAQILPQAYTNEYAISVPEVLIPTDGAGIARHRVSPVLGTSGFKNAYPPDKYVAELKAAGTKGHSVWLLESTTDDVLRALKEAP